jgi:hypothetical protein
MTATASNAPANGIDASAVFLDGRLISRVIYHANGSKEKRYYEHHFSMAVCDMSESC